MQYCIMTCYHNSTSRKKERHNQDLRHRSFNTGVERTAYKHKWGKDKIHEYLNNAKNTATQQPDSTRRKTPLKSNHYFQMYRFFFQHTKSFSAYFLAANIETEQKFKTTLVKLDSLITVVGK